MSKTRVVELKKADGNSEFYAQGKVWWLPFIWLNSIYNPEDGFVTLKDAEKAMTRGTIIGRVNHVYPASD